MAPVTPQGTAINPEECKEKVAGVIGIPLDEARDRSSKVQSGIVNKVGFVREGYADECMSGVNRMLNLAMNIRFITAAMAAYFDRDTVALPGIAQFFKQASTAAMKDAVDFLDYNNMRGGRVMLKTIPMPDSDYFDEEKGDALYAFELALALGKLKFARLKELHRTAREAEDPEMQDFLNGKLHEQALINKELGNYVCELHRVGKGHGVFHFDCRINKGHGHVLSATLHLPVAI